MLTYLVLAKFFSLTSNKTSNLQSQLANDGISSSIVNLGGSLGTVLEYQRRLFQIMHQHIAKAHLFIMVIPYKELTEHQMTQLLWTLAILVLQVTVALQYP